MSYVPIWHGRISDEGKFELAEQERDQRRAYLQTLAGQSVEVIVRKEKSQRSNAQNSYIHGVVLPLLAEELGYESIEDLKLALMGEKWGYIYDPIAKRDLPAKPSTAQMTVEECSEFIEWLPMWAMTTFNIRVPLPNEGDEL